MKKKRRILYWCSCLYQTFNPSNRNAATENKAFLSQQHPQKLTEITSLPAGLPSIIMSMYPFCVTSGSCQPPGADVVLVAAASCGVLLLNVGVFFFSASSVAAANTRGAPTSSGTEAKALRTNARRPTVVDAVVEVVVEGEAWSVCLPCFFSRHRRQGRRKVNKDVTVIWQAYEGVRSCSGLFLAGYFSFCV